MEVKPGYKKTALGSFPSNWLETTVGAFQPFVTSGSRGWAKYYADRGELFVRITNMTRITIHLNLGDQQFVKLPAMGHEGARTQLQADDLLVSVTADIGIVSWIDKSVPRPAYINQHIALIRFGSEVVFAEFIAYFLAHFPSQRRFRSITDQGAKAGINLKAVQDIPLVIPPTKVEQEAIAGALSDADALIESLEQLVAKKRLLKLGAMQQLLTGQKRLSGFHGDWEDTTLGHIGKFKNGLNKDSSAFGHGSPFVNLMDVFGVNAITSTNHLGLVASTKMDREVYDLRQGDVLFIRSSVKPSGVGLTAVVERDLTNTVYSGFLIRFRDDGALDCGFKKHCFYAESFRKKIIAASSVSANTNINQNALGGLTLLLPPTKAEQNAIATLLSEMDAELTGLKAKLSKARLVKEGMMQELLAGRIRLV